MKRRRAMLSMEYAVLVMVVVAALIGMSVYLKRAIMGKWRDAGDVFSQGRQYDDSSSSSSTNCLTEGAACPVARGSVCCDKLVCLTDSGALPTSRGSGKCRPCVDSCTGSTVGKYCCGGGICTKITNQHRGVTITTFVCK